MCQTTNNLLSNKFVWPDYNSLWGVMELCWVTCNKPVISFVTMAPNPQGIAGTLTFLPANSCQKHCAALRRQTIGKTFAVWPHTAVFYSCHCNPRYFGTKSNPGTVGTTEMYLACRWGWVHGYKWLVHFIIPFFIIFSTWGKSESESEFSTSDTSKWQAGQYYQHAKVAVNEPFNSSVDRQ